MTDFFVAGFDSTVASTAYTVRMSAGVKVCAVGPAATTRPPLTTTT